MSSFRMVAVSTAKRSLWMTLCFCGTRLLFCFETLHFAPSDALLHSGGMDHTLLPLHTFEGAFARLMGHEGGYVNHPNDPGGETKFGISRRSYPQLNIRALTMEDARAIYRRDFWDAMQADRLPAALRFAVFDAAVNSGRGNATRWLQTAAGVAADGHMGPVTMQAIALQSPAALAARFYGARLRFMTDVSTWPTFGRGWARRIASNLLEVAP